MHPDQIVDANANRPSGGLSHQVAHNQSVGQPFSVRLTVRERQLIAARANAEGVTIGAFVRRIVLATCGRPPSKRVARRDELATAIAGAIGLLGRISSSSNQVARAANSGYLRDGEATVALANVERQLVAVRELLHALGGPLA